MYMTLEGLCMEDGMGLLKVRQRKRAIPTIYDRFFVASAVKREIGEKWKL